MEQLHQPGNQPLDATRYLLMTDNELLADCEVHTYRSSGPGGQKKNKTSSAVRIHHKPSGLIAKGEEDRSQHVNKARALRRLRMVLATELLSEIDVEHYSPSNRMKARVSAGRLEVRLKDEDALLVINEVLSLVHCHKGRVSEAAAALAITTANLVKFLRLDLRVWRKVDQLRRSCGLKALKGESS